MSKNPTRSPGIFALYIWNYRTRCFIPLYMHIRISAGCISNLILSVEASVALRVFSEIQFVPLRVFPTFFSSPRHRVHSEKYIRREKERGRKKRQLAVCTRSFLSGRRRVAQEIRWNFAQNGKRAAGVLGYANSEIRDFMNDKTSGWAASSSKGRSDNTMEKDRDIGKESQASQRTSEPVTAWPYN